MNESHAAPRRTLRWWIVRLLLFTTLLIAVPATLLFLQQHSLIYYARNYPAGFEQRLTSGTIQLQYTTLAGQQVAFYVPPRSGIPVPEQLWVAFTGNASVALDWMFLVDAQPNDNAGFLLIDYPGYGRSSGKAKIATTNASANKALETLAEKLGVPHEQLSARTNVIGLSLGAAAALEFAAGHPVQRAVLIAPFTSLRDMAARLFTRPAALLLLENYDNRKRLRDLAERPNPPRVAIFHGTADTLIPPDMGRELAEAHPQMIEFFPVENATHDTVVGDAVEQIAAWMSR
jgi:uncharacterized protein